MDVVLKLNCPSCGAKLNVNLLSTIAVCNYCGQNSVINGLVSKQSTCPICGEKDHVQRVAAMMQSSDPVVQHLRIPEKPKIPSFAEFSLSRPENDFPVPKLTAKKKPIWIPVILGIVALLIAISMFGAISSGSSDSVGGLIITGIIFLGLAFIFFRLVYRWNSYNMTVYKPQLQEFDRQVEAYHQSQEEFNEDLHDKYEIVAKSMMDRWNIAMKRWEILYFCRRDYIVFVPGSGKYDEVKDILKYLYAQE